MTEQFEFGDKLKKSLFYMIGAGVIGLVLSFLLYPHNQHSRFWSSILINTYYFTGIGLFGLFFVSANQLGYGGWQTLIKRVLLSLSNFVLLGAALALLIVGGIWLGYHNLYDHWLHVHDQIVADKVPYLNKGFWTLRIVLYFGLWIAFAFLMNNFFGNQNQGDPATYKKSKLLAAAYIVVFAVTESSVSWDMIMSLDPHWYSTLFGWYNFASYGCGAFAFTILLVIYLKSQGHLAQVTENHIHDLGKFLFAFSVFWTYLWFSQFMLQWYGNIPEDTKYWVKRFDVPLFKTTIFLALIINFLLPLLVLMKRGAKRNYKVVSFAAVMIIFGHYIDFFNMVMPEPNWVASAHEEGGHEKGHGEHHGSVLSAPATALYAEAAATETKAEAAATDAMPATTAAAPADASHESEHAHSNESHAHAATTHSEAHAEHAEEAEVTYAGLGIAELLIFIGFAGMFLYMFFLNLAKRPLVPDSDPYLKESINHHI